MHSRSTRSPRPRSFRVVSSGTIDASPRPRCAVESLESRTLFAVSVGGITQTLYAGGISGATAMDFAPDGRLFVTEQGGNIRVIKDGQTLGTPFATVQPDANGERGLLGIAFDPDFNNNHYVYIYWTATTPNVHNRISRFTASGDTAVPGSRVDLFDLPALNATNHNGGAIHFGPDGKLYVGVGENANAPNAQNLSNVLGKMLRLNKDGSIPTDNPFYAQSSGNARAVWAYGLRNPFTFAFQPGSGKLYINDVGYGTYEEVNEGQRGANYGWPTTEGPTTDARFKGPITAYKQRNAGGEGSSITGGAFYNPPASAATRFDAAYTGDYFFADYGGNFIRVLDAGSGAVTTFATGMGGPVDLKVGPDGALYALGRNAQKVYKFTGSGSGTGATAPTITDPPDNVTVSVGQPATFTAQASGTGPLSYQWQRNGTSIAGATSASYTLASPQASDNAAAFRVVVTNSVSSVTSNPATLTITTNAAPVVQIDVPANGATYRAGDTINFAGAATDAEDGTSLPDGAFDWEIVFHHADHTHPFLTIADKKSGSFTIPTTGETAADVYYRLHLRVTDTGGRTTEVTRDLTPRVATIGLATNVPGLSLTLDGSPVTSPSSAQGVSGIGRAIGAPATQSLNGVNYAFVSWSDGGAATHAISSPDSDTTYTATYQQVAVGGGGGGGGGESFDLAAGLLGALPGAVVAGSAGKATVRVTNNGAARAVGPVTISLFASTDAVLDGADAPLASLTRTLKLGANKRKSFRMAFDYPAAGNGDHTLFARVDGTNPDAAPADNVAAGATPVTVKPPFIDLTGSILPTATPQLAAGEKQKVTVTVTNAGNAFADGPLTISLAASSDATWDVADAQLTDVTKRVKLKPGASRKFSMNFPIPDPIALPEIYRLVAGIDSGAQFNESEEGNNSAAAEPFVGAQS